MLELSESIQELLTGHPALAPSAAGHAKYADRYVSQGGIPIAHEKRNKSFQKLWVRADSVRTRQLRGLNWKLHRSAAFETGKPNHDLFAEAAFGDADLIEVKVADVWSAVRVIVEAVGDGA